MREIIWASLFAFHSPSFTCWQSQPLKFSIGRVFKTLGGFSFFEFLDFLGFSWIFRFFKRHLLFATYPNPGHLLFFTLRCFFFHAYNNWYSSFKLSGNSCLVNSKATGEFACLTPFLSFVDWSYFLFVNPLLRPGTFSTSYFSILERLSDGQSFDSSIYGWTFITFFQEVIKDLIINFLKVNLSKIFK
jgi:hypothetical protein